MPSAWSWGLERTEKGTVVGCRRTCGSQRGAPSATVRLVSAPMGPAQVQGASLEEPLAPANSLKTGGTQGMGWGAWVTMRPHHKRSAEPWSHRHTAFEGGYAWKQGDDFSFKSLILRDILWVRQLYTRSGTPAFPNPPQGFLTTGAPEDHLGTSDKTPRPGLTPTTVAQQALERNGNVL